MSDDSQEYSSAEVTQLVAEALAESPTLSMSWLETQLFGSLYKKLSTYMNPADVLVMLTDLRQEFFQGFTSTTPVNLHKVCKRCRKCENVKHPAVDPWWNVTDPDLMIVVENPTVSSAHQEFLVTALKTAGFRSNRCMLTFMTRCPAATPDITDAYIANCTPYLHSEMAACSPKLTLVLGAKTWGALTGDTVHKISELEGEVTWFGMYGLLPGMSLAWYARSAANSENRGNGRFIDLLSVAYNFLYAQQTVIHERVDNEQ